MSREGGAGCRRPAMIDPMGPVAIIIVLVIAIPVGTLVELDLVWLIADTLNAFMAIPNLIALGLLSPLVFRISRDYFNKH